MRLQIFLTVASLVFAGRAETSVPDTCDFAQPGPWRVGQGRLAGKEAAEQLRRDADGLHVTLDPFISDNGDLASVEQPCGKMFAKPGDVRQLVCRFSEPTPAKIPPRLLVRDAQREIFQFAPFRTRRAEDGAYVFSYRPDDADYTGSTWGSTNLNRRMDAPVSVLGFVFSYAEPFHRGTVTLVRYESANDETSGVARVVRGEEDLSDRLTAGYPGPKPFPGPDALVLTCARPPQEPVTVTLTRLGDSRPLSFALPAGRDMRFDTHLPFDEAYVLKSVSPRSARASVQLRGVFRSTAAEAARVDVATGNRLHISRGASEPVALTLRNVADRTLSFTGTFRVRDFWGHGFDLPISRTVEAGATVRFPVDRPLAKGIWFVTAQIVGEDGSKTECNTRFAVLDRHVVTPKVPFGHYRLGVNYHMARFNETDLAITLDALTAMGAKIVRAGIEARLDSCRKGPDDYHWERPDRLLGLLEERGIALDTIFYGAPKWARRPGFENARRPHLTPVREDALERFSRTLAARYGERIDYYELGNEWDLVKPGEMTAADAVALQKAAWRGIKAGNPRARLIPNGWALESSDHPMIVCKGFQEDVMEQAKGFYDIHPIHVHGRFPYYETRMREAFFALRRARGIDVPWYANETALTSAHGAERLVAETVYKKILWSQAFGSTDYIWYNLRATGWVPADGEQGYGLITADNYPRAGYAAFSALAAVFGGLDADATLVAERGRFVFRFKGTRDGRPYLALAGWDAPLADVRNLRVRTDAARASVVDLMGNETPCPIRDGVALYPLGPEPKSLALYGATRAEPDTDDLRAFPPPRVDEVCVPISDPAGRGPDFVLNATEQVQELWKANPATEYRTWKGPSDLSAEIRLGWTAEALDVLADVTDDRDVAGNGTTAAGDMILLRFSVDSAIREVWLLRDADGRPCVRNAAGQALSGAHLAVSREGVHTRYVARVPWKALGLRETKRILFDVRVLEDDGDGRDGWMSPAEPERADRFSRVRFTPLRQW